LQKLKLSAMPVIKAAATKAVEMIENPAPPKKK
jgi:hypothetical protein